MPFDNEPPTTGFPIPYKMVCAVGDLTHHSLGRSVTVWTDDRGSVRAIGTITKIGHEIDGLGTHVTWLGLSRPDGWRWYKQLPADTRVGLTT